MIPKFPSDPSITAELQDADYWLWYYVGQILPVLVDKYSTESRPNSKFIKQFAARIAYDTVQYLSQFDPTSE
jgi:hypothetical protein